MLDRASCGNDGRLNVAFAKSQHTLHSDLERDGYVKDEDSVSVPVNGDDRASMADTGRPFHRGRDDHVDGVVDLASTTCALLWCRLCLPNCFALSFRFLFGGVFPLSFCIVSSHCALKMILLKLACGLRSQYP